MVWNERINGRAEVTSVVDLEWYNLAMNSEQKTTESPETLMMLRQMVERLDIPAFSPEDLQVIESSLKFQKDESKTISLGGGLMAKVSFTDPGDTEPRLFLCMETAKAVGLAIKLGLSGADLVAQQLLRRCGVEETRIEEIIGELKRPAPGDQELN